MRELPSTEGVRAPRTRLLSAGRPVAQALLRAWYEMEIHGAERVPATGPLVMAANHVGWLDGPLLAICSPRPVHALTKLEMFEGPMGSFLLRAGQIPLDRWHVDVRAIRIALKSLREDHAIGVFPEGARGPGDMSSPRAGAGYLALVSGAPVVPVSFLGTRMPGGTDGSIPPRGSRIAMTFGEPVQLGQSPVATHPAAGGRSRSGRHSGDPADHSRCRAEDGHDPARPARPTQAREEESMSTDNSTTEPTEARIPILAVVGRPNVGKSTLVNRIIGRREAVVEDKPGVTRDRVSYDAVWNGRAFTVVDTGGWDPDARGLAESIRAQAEIAVNIADAVMFVVDAAVGITDADESVVRILRKSGKPVVLAANKVDDQRAEAEAYGLWNLGLGEPMPVSALHGRGSGDLLDAVLLALPEPPPEDFEPIGGPRRIAIIGRPNVGKSSLLNKLAGENRVVVDDASGTTVDPVDELVELGGRTWRFIDTAGIRKRVKTASGHEYYASLRTETAIERAEVAILVIDGSQSVSEQDMRIIQTVRDSGRALVIAFNKWDLVDEERRYYLDREIERDLVQVGWAPRINVTARTGWHIDRIVPALEKALEGWETRVTTGQLNSFLGRLVAEHPHPVRSGKQPKVLFGTQATTAPPTFVLFTSGKLDAGYERFIERRLREEFGFVGSPISLQVRPREKRKR